ncbi:hypothetical protein LFAB_08850 [Lactiplantibacillus fabifermentans T30PCM01]|uniref:Uncharacterized protein n=1 Tax=Lactiplantibacillus fabifermentans T30PCM01 TaxID=1400520 RepID=W6T785_9LACO|nr:hypothetical protein LFAB_08850 [Lactiplantibacillus fabifermentans T30PCM01]
MNWRQTTSLMISKNSFVSFICYKWAIKSLSNEGAFKISKSSSKHIEELFVACSQETEVTKAAA